MSENTRPHDQAANPGPHVNRGAIARGFAAAAVVAEVRRLREANARLNHDADTQYASARHLAEMDAAVEAAAEDLAAARAAQSEALGAVADLAITLKLVRDRIGGRIVRFVDAHGGLVPGVTANLIDGILSDLDGAK